MSFFLLRCAATLSQSINQAAAAAARHKHTLPDLTYDYGALEPSINAEIMQLHHSKHHATYVNNLNVTEEKYQEALAKGKNAKSCRETDRPMATVIDPMSSNSPGC